MVLVRRIRRRLRRIPVRTGLRGAVTGGLVGGTFAFLSGRPGLIVPFTLTAAGVGFVERIQRIKQKRKR